MRKTRCRACGSSLLVHVSFHRRAGREILYANTQVDLERCGADCSFRCPNCSAKNLVLLTTNPMGEATIEITRAVMDDM